MNSNQENKAKQWEVIKKEILNYIPIDYVIEVEGLEDDSIYFHPIIKIDSNYFIKGQSDISGNNKNEVYAWCLIKEYIEGCFIKTVGFSLNNLNNIKKLLENWDYYKIKIIKYTNICEKIEANITILNNIKNNIQDSLLDDTFLQEDRVRCLKQLYDVKEFIENERIVEKYSGLQ